MTDVTVILQGRSLALGQMLTALQFFCSDDTFQRDFYRLATQKYFPVFIYF